MGRKACTTRSDLEQMLAVETAEPKALPLSLLEDITDDFSGDREIGRGGFAVVYKGIIGDRAVAVKRLSNALMDDKEFHREVECLMRVKHKNVVRFLGYCADRQGSMATYNGKLVMADIHQRLLCFEYIPKGSLDKYIIDAHREWRTCYKIIKGICGGLQFLHDNHIVHLDLKPANILLDDSMVPKITDFGLSRCFDENQSRDITKTIKGTMGYSAPEFLEWGVIAPSVDLYSLGVIIIEILTGQKAYQPTGNVLESWSDRLDRSQRDTLFEQIRVCYEIALECIDFNPKKRPASARDIIDRHHGTESIQTAEPMAASCTSRSPVAATESKGKSKDVSASAEPSHAMAAPPGQTVVMPRPVGTALVQAASGSAYGLVETKLPLPARLGPHGAAMATRVSSMYDMVERMHYLYVSVVKARDLPTMDITGAQDPYVEVKLGNFKGVTSHLQKTPNPVWRQTFAFSRAHMQSSVLDVIVKDKGTLRDEFVGRLIFDLSKIPSRLPPDSPLAPQWYRMRDSHHQQCHGEIMLAVWLGSQADEAFPEAWHSEAHSLSPEALTNRRSQVYYSPKLICLKVVVIAAQDLIGAEKGRPLAPTIAKIQMGCQIRRTRPGQPQGSTNQAWNEQFMFVASEPFEDLLIVTVEERVAAGRDEPIGRMLIPVSWTHMAGNDLASSVPSKWFSLSRLVTGTETKHREHSKTFASKIIPVASPHVRRNYLSRWAPSPAKWFRLSRSRGMSVDEAAAAGEVAADVAVADEAAADVTAADVRIHLRMSLETAYHVPDESTRYSSDLQPAEEKLRKSAIGVLEVGILGARNLGDNKSPYCVAKYGAKWVRTRTLLGTAAPQWNEPYTWEVFDLSTVITVAVFNNNRLSGHGNGSTKDQRIGKVRVRLATLESGRVYTHYYPLMALSPSGLMKRGELHLAVRFTCTAWANMLAQYGRPLLPKMHYTNPISELQLDYLQADAMVILAMRLARADPPLPREVVEDMLNVESHMFSLRRSKANFNRITSLFSGVVAVAKWFDGISKWKNPLTTILVHVVLLKLVCYPELILPTVFLCFIMIVAWNYCRRLRKLPHMDAVLSHTEFAHPDELDVKFDTFPNKDALLWWYRDQTYPDELDEEFDTFPTSKPDDIVRRRYDRLRGIAGTVQTVAGDLAAQAERAHFLLRWYDPRATPIFLTLLVMVAVVLYLTPFRVVTMVMGLYFLRPPWFRGSTNPLFNFYSRLPSNDDVLLSG